MNSLPRCLCVGFYRPGTGLSRVMETLTHHLADRFEFHLIGIGYSGPQIDKPVTIYPCNLKGGDVYGAYQLRERIKSLQPDLVFLLNDLWILNKYGRTCADYAARIPFIAYAAIDGRIVDPDNVDELGFLHSLVAYTEFAKNDLQSAFTVKASELGDRVPQLSAIPHGVDTHIFHPLQNRAELRKRLFPQLEDPQSAFIVLNGNRPHGRKRMDLTIQAFAEFAHTSQGDTYLYLRNSIIVDDERRLIEEWSEQHDVLDRVILPSENAAWVDDASLNEIYNGCDVGINTSMGEGWGMVSLEHAAAGVAQIVPAHSACLEIWPEAALLTPIKKAYVPQFSKLELAEIDPSALAQQLLQLYLDKPLREQTAAACFTRVNEPRFSWATIADQWGTLFQKALGAEEARTVSKP